jgi:hypothetical protein
MKKQTGRGISDPAARSFEPPGGTLLRFGDVEEFFVS